MAIIYYINQDGVLFWRNALGRVEKAENIQKKNGDSQNSEQEQKILQEFAC